MSLPNDLAALVGFACEAVLWGVNATLFFLSLIILGDRRFSGTFNNPVVYLNCLIFSCCTTHFALEFYHYFTTLSTIGVIGYANETSQLMAADFLISVTDLLGDLVLIYRCWMLWGKNYYVIILPLLAAVSGFICIIFVLVLLISINPTSPAPPADLVPLGLAAYILPLCTNIIVTCLIVYRIWTNSRTIANSPLQVGKGATHHAMMLIIESGALYLLFQFVFVVLFAIPNSAEAILAVMAVQIYGIAPTLIIIRVGLGISSENTTAGVESTRINWVARRAEHAGTSATDVLGTNTDLEGIRESDLPKLGKREQEKELDAFDFGPTRRVEGIPSAV